MKKLFVKIALFCTTALLVVNLNTVNVKCMGLPSDQAEELQRLLDEGYSDDDAWQKVIKDHPEGDESTRSTGSGSSNTTGASSKKSNSSSSTASKSTTKSVCKHTYTSKKTKKSSLSNSLYNKTDNEKNI